MEVKHYAAPEIRTSVSCSVEATLPLRVSQKWVAYACRMAGVEKPRWNRSTSTWTTTAERMTGEVETISLRTGSTPETICIDVAWIAPIGSLHDTATTRRLVTSFFTGMHWAMRHRVLTRAPTA
jgi:hypothetical protein